MDGKLLRVAVGRPVEGVFTYRLPPSLGDAVEPGRRLVVPFGRSRAVGFVLPGEAEPPPRGLRDVLAVLDDGPVFDEPLLAFLAWAADYYRHPLGEALRGALPPGLNTAQAAPEPRRRVRSWVQLTATGQTAERPRGVAMRATLDYLAAAGREVELEELAAAIPGVRDPLKRLVERGLCAMREAAIEPERPELALASAAVPELTPDQAVAVEALGTAVLASQYAPFLLHGVTGSGKTEVYLRTIATALWAGRGALVLVPEIGLTPQLVGRFRARFGDQVAVLHSGLKDPERLAEWRRLRSGAAPIAVGVRSAIFAPVAKLGVVIVDEEHDGSFKQEEMLRYHARDLAVVRARMLGCPVVLGSATPSLETLHNARTGRYRLLELPRRIDDRPMPEVVILDMRENPEGHVGAAFPQLAGKAKLRAAEAERAAAASAAGDAGGVGGGSRLTPVAAGTGGPSPSEQPAEPDKRAHGAASAAGTGGPSPSERPAALGARAYGAGAAAGSGGPSPSEQPAAPDRRAHRAGAPTSGSLAGPAQRTLQLGGSRPLETPPAAARQGDTAPEAGAALPEDKGPPLLSPVLLSAIETVLEKRQQAILFLNRRGQSTYHLCLSCGHALTCPNCAVSLTLHGSSRMLQCHYCGHASALPLVCPRCSGAIEVLGMGTERLEEEVGRRFPSARLCRLDRDATSQAEEVTAVLASFARREADILVGTQMVAKGHDFPGVTLVGVLLADLALNLPDFRAAERTFQLLAQVAGRAGRGGEPGRVIVQTFNPEAKAVACVAGHDYRSFAEQELALREAYLYPPFCRLLSVRIDGIDASATAEAAHLVSRAVGAAVRTSRGALRMLGPAPAPIARLRGRTRWQILVKGPGPSALRLAAEAVERVAGSLPGNARATLDVDPIAML